jgi:hypothetical protein
MREDEPWVLHLDLRREPVEADNGIEAASFLV